MAFASVLLISVPEPVLYLPTLLPRLSDEFSVACLDLSQNALVGIKKRMGAFHKRLKFHVGSAEKLPFYDRSFACIPCAAGQPVAGLRISERVFAAGILPVIAAFMMLKISVLSTYAP